IYGWVGLGLISIFWILNWSLDGLRTHWGFFPLWLGYCLFVDGLVYYRQGTSLMTRSLRRYIGLFLLSAPIWWIFEGINWRLQNWIYLGVHHFSPLEYSFWSTLNFMVVIPAVFSTVEFFSSFGFLNHNIHGPVIRPNKPTTLTFFILGWVMLLLMMTWPQIFFPFAWLSLFFILEPINIWMGNHSLTRWTRRGNWSVIITLWLGVLTTGFFWELWNFYSYPKWIYQIPWGDWIRIYEMPLLGYGGYLPFALELYAFIHLVFGLLGNKNPDILNLPSD
ncbi:MAG: hypothetical protein ACNA8H_11170, partial [Anaerolineales bacterium]